MKNLQKKLETPLNYRKVKNMQVNSYVIQRNFYYDFNSESYSTLFPNIHPYPATMLPQIGIGLLQEFNIKKGKLLDPYVGSGSSIVSALSVGIKNIDGFDLNPLAILISKVRTTIISTQDLNHLSKRYEEYLSNNLKENINIPNITNINFWFSPIIINELANIKYYIDLETNIDIKNFLLLVFSETVREVSYTRNSEFKLYKMAQDKINVFKPDARQTFISKLKRNIKIFIDFYLPILKNNHSVCLKNTAFVKSQKKYNAVLTSPPYGDSRTTVAYGQFSTLSNEWLGVESARKLDSNLMGGHRIKDISNIDHCLKDTITKIWNVDPKRATEVASFYTDLGSSIKEVSSAILKNGYAIYIVGNRTVKDTFLNTDQFVAEQFCRNGFKHIITYTRNISGKSMPLKNSPTNKAGKSSNTMTNEYIVILQKI